MKVFGKELTKQQILSRVGDISQIARITDYRFTSGRGEGMRGQEVTTGSGLSFTVLPSRALDIAWAEYKGVPLAFISKAGIAAPGFYEKDGLGFLRNFTCGLVTTCGLTYMGAPCVDEGEALGLHGRVSNIPAQNTYTQANWQGDDYVLEMGGQVRESTMFGENMVLTRKISVRAGESKIYIEDTVENEGFEETPLMLLYHINFGFPVLDEHTELRIHNRADVKGRDARADEGLDDWMRFSAPAPGFTEQIYYHDPEADANGAVTAEIFNPGLELPMSVYVRYKKEQLPYLMEWKQTGQGDYVLGIEPGTWLPEGRAKAREKNGLRMLQPGEACRFELEIGVTEF